MKTWQTKDIQRKEEIQICLNWTNNDNDDCDDIQLFMQYTETEIPSHYHWLHWKLSK